MSTLLSPIPTSRREALRRLTLSGLLGAGLWPGALDANGKKSGENFSFVVLNDTHYMSSECGPWLERLVAQIKSHPGIDLCLIAGDLVEKGLLDHEAALRDIFKTLGVPIHVVIGNHDYLTQTERSGYEKIWPQSLNYTFRHRGWQFIGLDTTDGVRYSDTSIQAPTFAWLDRQVPELENDMPTIVFTHFPLAHGVTYQPRNADELLRRLRGLNVQAVFSGHYHGFTEKRNGSTVLMTNCCCALKRDNHDGTKEKGYFLCSTKDGLVQRQFVVFDGLRK